ncbi:CMP deaminase [bacterium]|nr:CMP deaminase [Candidatus Elulimicrobium humile]
MKTKLKNAYMKTAKIFAELSHAKRLHVGAIIVKDDRIISIGYNGMPAGWDNTCEDRQYMDSDAGGWLDPNEIEERWPLAEWDSNTDSVLRYKLVTKSEVLHAESNAIAKLAKSTESGNNATLFVTHSPCLDCAKLIFQSGINHVVFGQHYRDNTGLDFLKKSGVTVEQIDEGA